MALMITDTIGGNRQRMRCPAERGERMQALAVFVRQPDGGTPWH
ncbi:hypothetical protein [Roseateles sp.]